MGNGHRRGKGQGFFNRADDQKIGSGLEKQRELTAPSSIDGEEIRKVGQAAYDGGSAFKSVWKPGYLYLTGSRLLFYQGSNKIVEVSLSAIKEMTIRERHWIPAKVVDQLCLMEHNEKRKRAYYLYMTKPQPWKAAIEGLLREQKHG